MTWKIDDIVSHHSEGICRITSIEELNLFGEGKERYYVLAPIYTPTMKIYVQVSDSDDILRAPLTGDEIHAMIDRLPSSDTRWIEDEKQRQRFLSESIRTGSIEDLMQVVRMLYGKRLEKLRQSRKFHSSDEQYLKKAETIVNRELAHGLGIAPEEVPAYIRARLRD